MSFDAPRRIESAMIVRADWNWRRGPKWKAALAWVFGSREFVRTGKGDLAYLTWFRGEPYLIDIEDLTL